MTFLRSFHTDSDPVSNPELPCGLSTKTVRVAYSLVPDRPVSG